MKRICAKYSHFLLSIHTVVEERTCCGGWNFLKITRNCNKLLCNPSILGYLPRIRPCDMSKLKLFVIYLLSDLGELCGCLGEDGVSDSRHEF